MCLYVRVADSAFNLSSAVAAVDHPWPGFDPCEKVNETGQRVAKFAERHGVPFEFHGLTGKWESFKARDFDLRDDEVLAVISVNMHKISDECVLSGSPRELLLKRIRSLNPKVRMYGNMTKYQQAAICISLALLPCTEGKYCRLTHILVYLLGPNYEMRRDQIWDAGLCLRRFERSL